eukprot:5281679-Pyramimonas_sp.AAC.1
MPCPGRVRMQVAGRCCYMFEGGNAAVARVDTLNTSFQQHHYLIFEVWSEECMNRKGHLQRHIRTCPEPF